MNKKDENKDEKMDFSPDFEAENLWLYEFHEHHYQNCQLLLKNELLLKENRRQIVTAISLENNLLVCQYMDMLENWTKESIVLLKKKFLNLMMGLETVPSLCIDLRLTLAFNYLGLHLSHYHLPERFKQNEFVEMFQVLPVLGRVLLTLDASQKNEFERIMLIFKLNLSSLVTLDQKQATLVNACRIFIGATAENDFLQKVTFKQMQDATVSPYILCPDKDRSADVPLFLLPIMSGFPQHLASWDITEATTCINIMLTPLLARLCKYKEALALLPQQHEDRSIRPLLVYLRVWCLVGDKQRLEAEKLLNMMFVSKEGREGLLGCHGRVLQAKLADQAGKHEHAVTILRQAAKFHGNHYLLLQTLAVIYKKMNRLDAYLNTLDMILQCLITIKYEPPGFVEKVLYILHPESPPTAPQILYEIAAIFTAQKQYDKACKKMLETLTYMQNNGFDNKLPPQDAMCREVALSLLLAGKLQEALTIVAEVLIVMPIDVTKPRVYNPLSLLLSAKIQMTAENYDDAIDDIDRCISTVNKTGQMKILLPRCQLFRAQCTTALDDVPNTKHTYLKALNIHQGEREILLKYVLYLDNIGAVSEAKRTWWDLEKKHPKPMETTQPRVAYKDPVIEFLLAPIFTSEQLKEAEEEVKTILVKP